MEKIKNILHSKAFIWSLRVLVIVAVVALLVVERTFWTPDVLFFMLLAVFVVFGQARAFFYKFAPLIILLLAYEGFRSLVPHLNTHVHYWEMIHFDQWLGFGHTPTWWLQRWLWHGHVTVFELYLYFLYTIHFLMPIALGVLIWKKFGNSLYWQFMVALLVLSYGAFITYLLFPAAPPWMASELGYIDHIRRISSDVWWTMGIKDFSGFYAKLSPNPVAAVPSLHSAYPTLFALFINKMYGFRKSWFVWLYPASIWLGVVYLGEHFVIDVLLGVLYAVLAFYGTNAFFKWQTAKNWPIGTKITGLWHKYIHKTNKKHISG